MPGRAPEKKQRQSYSGKKKRHTQKAQVVADPKSKRIRATSFCAGKMHDFKLFVQSRLPHKKSKLHPLTREQKGENRKLSGERFVIEHVMRSLRIFRILSERYRNRRKRFGLRFNLIAALYNQGLNQ